MITKVLVALDGSESAEKEGYNELIPFSYIVYDYIKQVDDAKLFNIKSSRALSIVTTCTGMWIHWFRAQASTAYATILGDSTMLTKFIGWVNPNTASKYMGFDYRQFLKSRTINPWYKQHLRKEAYGKWKI